MDVIWLSQSAWSMANQSSSPIPITTVIFSVSFSMLKYCGNRVQDREVKSAKQIWGKWTKWKMSKSQSVRTLCFLVQFCVLQGSGTFSGGWVLRWGSQTCICMVSSGSFSSWTKARQLMWCIWSLARTCVDMCVCMETSDASAELKSSSLSVELLSESLSLLR